MVSMLLVLTLLVAIKQAAALEEAIAAAQSTNDHLTSSLADR
jgi:hypothetical protein